MRIRGYLPRGIALVWLLGIKLEECEAEPVTKDKLRDVINRFIKFVGFDQLFVKYEVRELSRSFLIRFTSEVSESAAQCRRHSDYEFKDCVYTCVSSNIPLLECEVACREEVADVCEKYGHTASWMNVSSIAHDLASLFEACNVKYYAHFGASTELYTVLFVAFFQ
jgi:hypothetical protein